MPILTISEIVNNELSQMRFQFGGSPADVVEYPDGGRKASGQAVAVQGLEAVTDNWILLEPTVVPTADGNGVIPEFYGPQGIIALRVDFGFGSVVLRADAANLHKELRDILLARLSQLQVDNDSFRAAVTAELDAMRVEIDTTVANTLAQVDDIIAQQQDTVIQQKVDEKLATDLAPTLEAAVNDALATDIPPLITSEVATQVPPAVTAATATLQGQIDTNATDIQTNGVAIANVAYDLAGTKTRVSTAENRLASVEILVTLTPWSRTASATDCTMKLNLYRLQNVVFGEVTLTAKTNNGGAQGFVSRTGMGIPSAFLPSDDGMNIAPAATLANGELVVSENFRLGIAPNGRIISQGYDPWHVLRGNFVYFTS